MVRSRRLDAVSALVVAGIFLTVGATVLGGSARLIQIRDALVTGMVGVLFLTSLILEKPLIFHLARAFLGRNPAVGAATFDELWARPGMPRTFRTMTAVWGVGLVGQTALMCWLAWIWPVDRYLLVAPALGYGLLGLLLLWSLWFAARRQIRFNWL